MDKKGGGSIDPELSRAEGVGLNELLGINARKQKWH